MFVFHKQIQEPNHEWHTINKTALWFFNIPLVCWNKHHSPVAIRRATPTTHLCKNFFINKKIFVQKSSLCFFQTTYIKDNILWATSVRKYVYIIGDFHLSRKWGIIAYFVPWSFFHRTMHSVLSIAASTSVTKL